MSLGSICYFGMESSFGSLAVTPGSTIEDLILMRVAYPYSVMFLHFQIMWLEAYIVTFFGRAANDAGISD